MTISAASKATVTPLIPGAGRPPPPTNFRAREKQLWNAIVNSMPPNWFTAGTLPVLARLVAQSINAERIEATMRRDHWDDAVMKPEFHELVTTHIELSKQIVVLANKLRLLPAARCEATAGSTARKLAAIATKPWCD